MEVSINFIPLDYDHFDYEGKTYAKITGRNQEGKRVVIIDSCDVYFWVILKPNLSDSRINHLRKEIEKIEIEKERRKTKVVKTELYEKNFLGERVQAIKIFISNIKEAKEIVDMLNYEEIKYIREYDLDFITRYIIEKKLRPLFWYKIDGELLNNSYEFGGIDQILEVDLCIKVKKIEKLEEEKTFIPKILAYDIETDSFDIGKGEIVMISLVGEKFKKVLSWKKNSSKDFVEFCKDEEEMIKKFIKYVKDYSPDILAGYNSDGFDLPYLKARAEKNKIKLNLGIDNSEPHFSRGKQFTGKIKGIVHLDILRFIKVVYAPYLQSETLSLEEVAKELIGENKIKFNFKHSSQLNHDEWENFFEYNLQDSILTYKLTEKLWHDFYEFSKIIGEPLFNICRDSMASHVENYIIHNIYKYNEIIEKKPTSEIGERILEDRYEGAFVLQPKPGLYEDIVFFDFTSMYGSVIVSFNLSKSTLRKEKEKDSIEVEIEGKKVYFTKKPGFFPEMLKEIIEKRKKYKKEYQEKKEPLLKARSNAFKLLANASYGYQGFFGARYYCREAAAATALIAKKYIKKTISFIEKEGYEVIYSDTDSIAFKRGKKSKKEILELLKKINEDLPGIMELELEDFYKRGIWVTKRTGEFGAKKKYALITEDGNLKIRGFETVRRDWCNLARTTQNKVLELILKEGKPDKAIEFVKEIIHKLKERKIDLKDLIIRTQLKKTLEEYKAESPHVTIAKKMKEKNLPVRIGMLIEYYISEIEKNKKTKDKILIRERAKLPEEEGKYDIDYYLNNQILPAVENIFEVFNINTKELLNGKKQKSLMDF